MDDRHVLVFDDDGELRDFLSLVITKQGLSCSSVGNFADLVSHLKLQSPNLIILDLSLGETDGVEVLRHLGSTGFKGSILLISSFEERLLRSAASLGASYGLNMLGNIQKPLKAAEVRTFLDEIPDANNQIREEELDKAIRSGHLFLNFQPKVDLKTGQVLSAEALVRWNDPRKGMIFPDQFIGLAEKTGLIMPMTDTVITLALQEAKRWQDQGWNIAVAVNLSPCTLTDLELPNKIAKQLRDLGLGPGKLILEVTESTAMSDASTTLDILTRLRIKGIRVSLDDFGTGYSSLVELHRMPFSEIKIDQTFVTDADTDRDSRIIVEAILGLAKAMDLKCVAEGVESEAQWNLLTDLGCDMAQGFYLSHPLPPADFSNWYSNWTQGSNSRTT